MSKFLVVLRFTIVDLMHRKSFYALLGIGIILLLMFRGCYGGTYVVQGQEVDPVTVAWHVSNVAFHIVAGAGLLTALLLSMSLLPRDLRDGTAVSVLTRPVKREWYVLGRLAGVWVVSTTLMVTLHLVVMLISVLNVGGTIPGFIGASLLCSLNLLFIVLAVGVVSLVTPEFIAGILGAAVLGVSLVSDTVYRVSQLEIVRRAINQTAEPTIAWWRILWPKVFGLQYFAGSTWNTQGENVWGYLHPVVNIVVYTVIAATLVVLRYRAEEV